MIDYVIERIMSRIPDGEYETSISRVVIRVSIRTVNPKEIISEEGLSLRY